MAYATYEFYQKEYHGKAISADDFNRLAVRASAFIDKITFGRASEMELPPNEATFAVCAVCEELYRQEHEPEITSQTVGPWTKHYKTNDKSQERRLYDAAALYLANTGLLYRGC